MWTVTHKFDKRCAALADRHYSRRSPGSPQFAPPGRVLVLLARTIFGDAVWVSREERRDRTTHAWPGAWQNPIFRNESSHLSSDLIRAAVAETVRAWGPIPPEGLVTLVDAEATKRGRSRRSPPGRCFLAAGFRRVGVTRGGARAFRQSSAHVRRGGVAA